MTPKIVDVSGLDTLDATIGQLPVPKAPIILLLGTFDSGLDEQIRSIFSRVVAPISHESGALIVDDASNTGPGHAIGLAAADQDYPVPLLGIVPNGRAEEEIEKNHPVVLRLPADCHDPVRFTFQILDRVLALADMQGRAVALLFGGNDEHKRWVIRCARRSWPVIVFENTGGLANKIALQVAADSSQAPGAVVDVDVREILETAKITIAKTEGALDDLGYQISVSIDPKPQTAKETLEIAWSLFQDLDAAAIRQQKWFRAIELLLLCLAVTAAVLAELTTKLPWPPLVPGKNPGWDTTALALHVSVIVIPIAISIVGAYNSHFRDGVKWILLRGSAEALKREIFRFRTKSCSYSDEKCGQISREIKLAAKLKEIFTALEQSEVNKQSVGADRTNRSPEETAYNYLSPDQYVTERVEDQIGYLEKKTVRLAKRLKIMQTCIYLAGGAGTFLAAIERDVWVAVATAVVAAFTSKIQADQLETSLVQYNQTLGSLRSIKCWWYALSPWEKSRPKNRDLLVDQSERAMETETAGWVQQMQTALEKLTEKETATGNK